ncbi:MAG: glutaminase A [Erysipelotrichaceae bacterium]|nr:glutaminase A [Erysipelotrichaceae bacterium]
MHFTFEQPHFDRNDPQEIARVVEEAYINGKEESRKGKVADYIPELAKADENDFGICVKRLDGETFEFGDVEKRFSIQSISKVINLAASLKFLGFQETFSHVRMEPTGDAFNSILKLDTVDDHPFNPMINAGAIQVMSMLSNMFDFEDLLQFARKFCMDDGIVLNEKVYQSEYETGDRNRAITYLLKSKGVLQGDPHKTLDLYFKMCSLNVNARTLANMGLVLANGGQNPYNGKHIIHPGYLRTIKSLMYTCGLYDESGEYAVMVGIPSKSGVGGGIIGTVDDRYGIGTYGPALNEKGNSVGGIAAMQQISHLLHLNVFYK